MFIEVVYFDNRHDYIEDSDLDRLIESRQVARFLRGTGWVSVGVDPVRGVKGSKHHSRYDGPERRTRRRLKSFDDLREADFQQVYAQSQQEVLWEYAFRATLDAAGSLEKLKALVFDSAAGLQRWTARELLEISNRFRLLSAPEYEIRLYEDSQNTEFRAIPRAREFYLLALNKVGRSTEAILECRKLITEGGENGLVWGILGDAYSLKMLSAEQFAAALDLAEGDITRLGPCSRAEFVRHFPDLDLQTVTLEQVHELGDRVVSWLAIPIAMALPAVGRLFPASAG